MITEAQYKRFGIHDQVLDLTADQMKLKPIFESPSTLARKKYDRRVVELIDRMLRRLDRLDDTVRAILETLPPSDEEYDDDDDVEDAEEFDENDDDVEDAEEFDEDDDDVEDAEVVENDEEEDDSDDAGEEDEEDYIDDAEEEDDAAEGSVPVIFEFRCPFCGQMLEAELEWQGKLAECSSCHKQFNIPTQN